MSAFDDVARNDQIQAAVAELVDLLVEADQAGAPTVRPPGPVALPVMSQVWARADAGALRRCVHLASPAPATVLAACPDLALCRDCLAQALAELPARARCDGCGGRPADGTWRHTYALGPLALYLALCDACYDIENGGGA